MASSSKQPFKPIRYWVQIQRAIAYILDYIVISIPIYFFGRLLGLDKGTSQPMAIVLTILILTYLTAYFVYCEHKWGQTIGKKVLGIKVYMDSGKPVTLKAAIIRRVILYIVLIWWLELALMYLTTKKQRLGDLLAHTVVVRMY